MAGPLPFAPMNWVHLHLALNHVPVLGALFGALLLAMGLVRRSDELQRVSLWALALLAAVSIPIKFTGDFASEALAAKGGAPATITLEPKLLNTHEQAADQATTGVFLLGLVAAAGLFAARGGRALPKWAVITSLGLALVTFLLMARTANLGGQLRHPEIRGP
jgi:uncharacterized membrane protein